MNKRANRKAFFICAAICLLYISVILRIPEKLSIKRISDDSGAVASKMNSSMPMAFSDVHEAESTPPGPARAREKPTALTRTNKAKVDLSRDGSSVEPSLIVAIPLVCYALREQLIEKDGLIFIKKEGYNTTNWKKPLEILKDKDEDGLRSISKIIGKKQILAFLNKEGITISKELDVEDIVLGRGYVIEKRKLLSLYKDWVSEEYSGMFPFVIGNIEVRRNRNAFELAEVREDTKVHRPKEEPEWMMPNLQNLSIKAAIEQLTIHTSKVKVFGSGGVTDQLPKPFERIRGEAECTIYGRTFKGNETH
jgi:hypothetical protein